MIVEWLIGSGSPGYEVFSIVCSEVEVMWLEDMYLCMILSLYNIS